MSNANYFKYWRLCAACGPIFLTAFLICWGMLGYNIPPIPADHTPDQMADFFRNHYNEVRAGMECGIRIEGFREFQIGDSIECYTMEKIAQKL